MMELTAVIRHTSVGMIPVTQPMKVSPPALNSDIKPSASFATNSINFLHSVFKHIFTVNW
jgi:hypothetical protein